VYLGFFLLLSDDPADINESTVTVRSPRVEVGRPTVFPGEGVNRISDVKSRVCTFFAWIFVSGIIQIFRRDLCARSGVKITLPYISNSLKMLKKCGYVPFTMKIGTYDFHWVCM